MQYIESSELYHGRQWKNHKYIRIENGRYIYPGDKKQGRKSAQQDYEDSRTKLKELKKQQAEYESMIDDDSLGDDEKTKRTYDAGDRLDEVIDKIDKLSAQLKKKRSAYKNTFGRKMSDDLKKQNPQKSPKSEEELAARRKEIKALLADLQIKRKTYRSSMDQSINTSKKYYKESDQYKKDKKSAGYQVNGIIGKKYESAGRRYASKLNSTDKKISELNSELKKLGSKWIKKKFKV